MKRIPITQFEFTAEMPFNLEFETAIDGDRLAGEARQREIDTTEARNRQGTLSFAPTITPIPGNHSA